MDYSTDQNILSNLINELLPVTDFSILIKSREFWKALYRLRNPDLLSTFQQTWVEFYKCPNCKNRMRRFANGEYYCTICTLSSSSQLSIPQSDLEKLECLKCFRLLHRSRFSGNCLHMCLYCAGKEYKKSLNQCKICSNQFDLIGQVLNCNQCNEAQYIFNMYEIRCGHVFCLDCIKEAKKAKRCLLCPTNIITSELYEINTREQELCFVCEVNKPFSEFTRKRCCNLDICTSCVSSKCPVCEADS